MSGYIQIEINGNTVGLKYNVYAMEVLSEVRKQRESNFGNLVGMAWAGYCGNCFAKQIDEQLSFEEVSEWVESIYLDGEKSVIFTSIAEAFNSSQVCKKLTENADEAKKKNQNGSKSMSLPLEKSA